MIPPFFEFVNYYAGVISIVVGVLAIWLSVMFYLSAKKSETETVKLLAAINERVETLGSINNNLLGTAIQSLASSNSQMIEALREYNQNIHSAQATQPVSSPVEQKGNVRGDILDEIHVLTNLTGRSLSFQLFDRLKHKYDFGTILSELLNMAKAGLVSWPEFPNPPEALSEIKLKNKTS